jgi:hypothetical protein
MNADVKHVCNSGTTVWNSGKGKESDTALVILRCKGRGYKDVYWKPLKNGSEGRR